MDANPSKLLSVVVPAHNEARGIAHAIDVIVNTLASCGMRLEVVIVDDGSRDGTFERVAEVSRKDARIKAIRFTRNFGKEAALLAGIPSISTGAGPCGDSHALTEWCEIEPFYKGTKKIILMELALAQMSDK